MSQPSHFQHQTMWRAVTGVCIAVLGALLVGFIWLLGSILEFLQPVLIPLTVAGIIAYVLDPVVKFLEARGLKRLWAVVGLFFILLTGAILLVAALVPGVMRGQGALRERIASSHPTQPSAPLQPAPAGAATDRSEHLAPALVSTLRELHLRNPSGPIHWILTETDDQGKPLSAQEASGPESMDDVANTRGGRMINDNLDLIFNTARSWLTAGSTKLLSFLGLLLGFIMVPIYLFFFLKDSAAIRTNWHNYVPLKSSRFKTSLVETLQEINGYLVSFFRGQVIVSAIDGLLVGIMLTVFGLPYGFIIGVFMALLGVIPYIGSILCLIPACLIGFLHAQTTHPFGLSPLAYVGCIVAIFVVVQQINSLVTAPKIVGESVGLHPLTVIFSMLFWSLVLGGFVGALLAVPMTAAVKVLFRRFIWERQLGESLAEASR